ncbi:MAG: hypothetical protein ACI30R_00270 [Sodaliphilus sp.]
MANIIEFFDIQIKMTQNLKNFVHFREVFGTKPQNRGEYSDYLPKAKKKQPGSEAIATGLR